MIARRGVVAVALLVLAAGLALAVYLTRPQAGPAASSSSPGYFSCPRTQVVGITLQRGARVVEMRRATPHDDWSLTQPVPAPANQDDAAYLLSSITSVALLNTISQPQALASYGLLPARESVTCRLDSGSSSVLSIGNQSFDGSGYYAQASGDTRVRVISAVEVIEFDHALDQPPVAS